jgi:hypothetical protein
LPSELTWAASCRKPLRRIMVRILCVGQLVIERAMTTAGLATHVGGDITAQRRVMSYAIGATDTGGDTVIATASSLGYLPSSSCSSGSFGMAGAGARSASRAAR